MNTAHLVDRMLASTSSGSSPVVDKYLQVFGVTNFSKALPLVFDPQYAPVWDAFVTDRHYSSKDRKVALLLSILDFVKFMRQQRTNPFVSTEGKGLNSSIRPVDMAMDLVREDVKISYATVLNYLRKTSITSYLRLDRKVVQTSLDKRGLNINLAFIPIRKESLEKVIASDLRGTLYRSATLPIQLQPMRPSNAKAFKVVISTLNTSTSEWLPMTAINNLKIFARVTKDALAVRITLPIDTDLITSPREIQQLVKLWNTVK